LIKHEGAISLAAALRTDWMGRVGL